MKPRSIFDADCHPSPDQEAAIRRAAVEKALSIYQRKASLSPDHKILTLTSKYGLETIIQVLTDPETGAYLGLDVHQVPPAPPSAEQPYETLKRLYQFATDWNTTYPIGTPVLYQGKPTTTRSALNLQGHDRLTIYIHGQRLHVPFDDITLIENQ